MKLNGNFIFNQLNGDFIFNPMIEIILSSHKREYGLRELLSENENDFWCSDAFLPHKITIKFNKKVFVYSLDLELSYIKDESYTPETVRWFFNSKEDETQLFEPEGWTSFYIGEYVSRIDFIILTNHTDGKDSHVHNLRLMKSPTEMIHF